MTTQLRNHALLALALLIAACASGGPAQSGNPFQGGTSDQETVQVTVHNQNFKDATIWALWDGTRIRVGDVTGNTSRAFTIRYRRDRVRFEVDYVAGGGYVGDPIDVSPGDHLELTLRPNG